MAKNALVIGAGTQGGIGFAIAAALAADSMNVAIMDIGGDLSAAAAQTLAGNGATTLALTGDATDDADVAGAVTAAEVAFGGLDVVVNNVGFSAPGDTGVEGFDPDMWDRTMRINIRPAMLGSKHAIPALRRRGGGAIINTSSTSSLFGSMGLSAYGSAKAAVNALTKHVATQVGQYGIRSNAVIPGYIETTNGSARATPAFTEAMLENILLPRIGRPEDIGAMVAFLASDKAEWITGQLIAVDGGLSAHAPQYATLKRVFGDGDYLRRDGAGA